jgi:hypothetical protein
MRIGFRGILILLLIAAWLTTLALWHLDHKRIYILEIRSERQDRDMYYVWRALYGTHLDPRIVAEEEKHAYNRRCESLREVDTLSGSTD